LKKLRHPGDHHLIQARVVLHPAFDAADGRALERQPGAEQKRILAMAFVLSLFVAIAVQKNTRDLKVAQKEEA
jgi:hypothetical protein